MSSHTTESFIDGEYNENNLDGWDDITEDESIAELMDIMGIRRDNLLGNEGNQLVGMIEQILQKDMKNLTPIPDFHAAPDKYQQVESLLSEMSPYEKNLFFSSLKLSVAWAKERVFFSEKMAPISPHMLLRQIFSPPKIFEHVDDYYRTKSKLMIDYDLSLGGLNKREYIHLFKTHALTGSKHKIFYSSRHHIKFPPKWFEGETDLIEVTYNLCCSDLITMGSIMSNSTYLYSSLFHERIHSESDLRAYFIEVLFMLFVEIGEGEDLLVSLEAIDDKVEKLEHQLMQYLPLKKVEGLSKSKPIISYKRTLLSRIKSPFLIPSYRTNMQYRLSR